MDRPDHYRAAEEIAGYPQPQRGAGWVFRIAEAAAVVAKALPALAKVLATKLPAGQAFRVVIDMGFATVEVFDVLEARPTIGFARHLATVEMPDAPDVPAN